MEIWKDVFSSHTDLTDLTDIRLYGDGFSLNTDFTNNTNLFPLAHGPGKIEIFKY